MPYDINNAGPYMPELMSTHELATQLRALAHAFNQAPAGDAAEAAALTYTAAIILQAAGKLDVMYDRAAGTLATKTV